MGGGRRYLRFLFGKRRRQRSCGTHTFRAVSSAFKIGLGQKLGVFNRGALLLHQYDLNGFILWPQDIFRPERDAQDDNAVRNDGKTQRQDEAIGRRDLWSCSSGNQCRPAPPSMCVAIARMRSPAMLSLNNASSSLMQVGLVMLISVR